MNEVEKFITQLEHPLKAEMLQLRHEIKSNFPDLTEIIKWNAPSYQHNSIDFLTFNLARPKDIKLILHRGAKNKELPATRLIDDNSGILSWAANDRAIMTFTDKTQMENQKEALVAVIQKWRNKL